MAEPANSESAMGLILHGGTARSHAMNAIRQAKAGDFEAARASLAEADKSFIKAHAFQKSLLTQEVRGGSTELSLLLIHGKDHLMTAQVIKDLAVECVDLYERIDA